MKKLVLTQGAPGSGKTTWANEYVAANPGWYVLSRDDLREGIFGLDKRNDYKYSKLREKSVSVCQFSMAKTLLEMETTKGVIIADTNLNPTTIKKWQELAYEIDGVKWEIKRFDVPWTELVKRNLYRGANAVPIEVLRSFYSKMHPYDLYIPDESLPKAVIFDLDGTLADNNHRSPYDLALCGKDHPKEMVIEFLKMLRNKGYKILTVSGRESGTKEDPTVYQRITKKWLLDHVGETGEHFQRKQGDSRKDDVVKEEIFWDRIADRYNVKLAVDDRAQVVEMWRRIGVECWQVAHGDF